MDPRIQNDHGMATPIPTPDPTYPRYFRCKHPPRRSKYMPHVGGKELAKIEARKKRIDKQ